MSTQDLYSLSMAHIVIDARVINSGTGRYMERLLHYLQKIDGVNHYSVIIKQAEHWQPTAKNFTAVAADIPDFGFAEQFQLLRLILKLKPDAVHFTMPQFPILFDLFRIHRINTIHDLTLINFKHSKWNSVVDAIKRAVFRAVMRRAAQADRVITPSRFVKSQLVARYPVDPSRITVTYESADRLAKHSKEYRPLKGREFIMYTGTITPYKNVRRLVEAFDLLKIDHPKLHLAIVGKEKRFHRELRGVVKQLGVENVVFTGFIPDEQLAWMYEHASAYVFPSLSEGFGLPGVEALVHGCPIVAARASCLPEVLQNGAHYFNPLDVEDMSQKINDVLTDSNVRKTLLQNGENIAQSYSWEKMANETLALYTTLLR